MTGSLKDENKLSLWLDINLVIFQIAFIDNEIPITPGEALKVDEIICEVQRNIDEE